jgi:hypothetical protein
LNASSVLRLHLATSIWVASVLVCAGFFFSSGFGAM